MATINCTEVAEVILHSWKNFYDTKQMRKFASCYTITYKFCTLIGENKSWYLNLDLSYKAGKKLQYNFHFST